MDAPSALPAFTVLALSDSFSGIWEDLAEEVGGQVRFVTEAAEIEDAPLAVVVAAGGVEDRALDVVPEIRAERSSPVFVVGANPSHRFAVEAVRRGAEDYLVLPGDLDLLRRTLAGVAERARARTRSQDVVTEGFGGLLGESEALRETLRRAVRVLEHDTITVLVQGETGTGKELLARAIHDRGPRRHRPFVAVNCAAIPPNLLESELFGHVRGAFTDAHRDKAGLFEEAHQGTLFLDEIGHLPLPLQAKILRVLEERTVRRVGGAKTTKVDVRIISATHVRLQEAVRDGTFREDLYFRLNVVPLELPPLRERGDDIVLLAESFVASLAERYGLPVPPLTREFVTELRTHSWPGNVRELRHAVERALLLSPAGQLDPAELGIGGATPSAMDTGGALPFPASIDTITTAAAAAMMDVCGGNKSEAARRLGVSRPRLQRLLDKVEDRHHA